MRELASQTAKFFTATVKKVALEVEGMAGIHEAAEYSPRRGGITARLRCEDTQTIAAECGTSFPMLDRHYSFALAEYRRQLARPLDAVWREARSKVFGDVEPARLRVVR